MGTKKKKNKNNPKPTNQTQKQIVYLFTYQHDYSKLNLLNATPIIKKDDPFPIAKNQGNDSKPVKW